MGKRQVRLLGPIRIDQPSDLQREGEKGTESLPRFRSKRTMALLAYLAAERRSFAREFLAALFWPDETLSKGRSNLRRELHNLKDILPDCWDLTRRTVEFIASEETNVDIHMVLELEAKGRWQEAAELLAGDFAEGLFLEDNAEFETWLFSQRENWRERTERIYSQIIQEHEILGRYTQALEMTRRLLGFTPWDEDAHRRAMRLLVWSGQENEALRQYSLCEKALREELDVEPSEETKVLYQHIKDGELPPPPRVPSFLAKEAPQVDAPPLIFVGRQKELSQLDSYLDQALEGESQVVFITGSPGSGKTFLLKAFTHQCIQDRPNLVIAKGNCYPYSGTGDPYLPFRDIMEMLVGGVESMWEVGAISQEHASRLWKAHPDVLQNLLDYGPHVLDTFIQESSLRSRLETAPQPSVPWIPQLREHLNLPRGKPQDVRQSQLFHQFTNVIRETASEYPLILILEDIHWADTGSIDLIYHLGRRISATNSRVLVLCSYRPVEVEIGRRGERHPLSKILNELKMIYGDRSIDLGMVSETQRRAFVDDFLDAEPNRLSKRFREALFHRTNGHPLFTVELFRSMQERGDLVKEDKTGWMESQYLNWEHRPPRVEAVIQERIEQVAPAHHDFLTVASVEGEVFTAQVISDVLEKDEMTMIEVLSNDLTRKHDLLREEGIVETQQGRLSRFRFRHALFQDHLYKNIGQSERLMMHERVAAAIEKYHSEDYGALAYHYGEAGIKDQAQKFYTLAGEKALTVYAHKEAEGHFRAALDLSKDDKEKAGLLAELGEAYYGQGLFSDAVDAWQEGIKLYRESGNLDRVAWLYTRCGRAIWDMGDSAGSVSICEQGLKELEGAPESDGLANLLNRTALSYRFNNMHEDFFAIAPRAHDMAMRVGGPDARVGAMLNLASYMIRTKGKSHEELINIVAEAVEVAESAGIYQALGGGLQRLGILIAGNEPHKALKYLQRGRDLSRRIGQVVGDLLLTFDVVCTNSYLGDLNEARVQLDDLKNGLDGVSVGGVGLLILQSSEVLLLGFQGHYEEAIKILTPALHKAMEANQPQWIDHCNWLLGEFHLEIGREKEAGEFIILMVDNVVNGPDYGIIISRILMAIKSIQEGKLNEAWSWLNSCEKLYDEYRLENQRELLRWRYAKARLLSAEKKWAQAWDLFEEAIEGAREIGFKWFATRFKLSWAEAHLERGEEGDQAKGLEMLKEVKAEYKDMGADGWVKRVGKRIKELEKVST